MRLKLIACKALYRELAYVTAFSENIVDMTWVRQGLHERPEQLREALQKEIDAVESGVDTHTNRICARGAAQEAKEAASRMISTRFCWATDFAPMP